MPTNLWPGWERLPKFANDCGLHRPIDITAAVPKLTWSEVPGVPGWQVMKPPGLGLRGNWFSVDPKSDRVVANQYWSDSRSSVVYRYSDGAPLAAFRTPGEGSCVTMLGGYGRVVGTFYRVLEKVDFDHGLIWSTAEDLAKAEDFTGKYQESEVGSMASREVAPTSMIWSNMLRLDFESGKIAPIPRPPNMGSPRVQHTAVIMTDKATLGSVVSHSDGTWDVWPTNVRGIGTDGTVMAWQQGELVADKQTNGPTFSHCELWTAPYTTNIAGVASKKVARMPTCEATSLSSSTNTPLVADGMAAFKYENQTVEVYRLSDGVHYVLPYDLPPSLAPVPGYPPSVVSRILQVLSVSNIEVIVSIGYNTPVTAVRIPLASLTAIPPPP